MSDLMDRRAELKKALQNVDVTIINPLIDEILYLENQLNYLRDLPKIRVNPNNPEQQKTTPAAKLYKEYLQQYLNALKLLLKTGDTGDDTTESPLRKWVQQRIDKIT